MQSHWWLKWILGITVATDCSENIVLLLMECLLRIYHCVEETSKIRLSSIIHQLLICSSQNVPYLSYHGMMIWKTENSMKWFHFSLSYQKLMTWEMSFQSLLEIIKLTIMSHLKYFKLCNLDNCTNKITITISISILISQRWDWANSHPKILILLRISSKIVISNSKKALEVVCNLTRIKSTIVYNPNQISIIRNLDQ